MKKYKRFQEEKKEGITLKKDVFRVNMEVVKNYDNIPHYIRIVQQEIKRGGWLCASI